MDIKIYNTLTKKKEILKTLKKGECSIYSCGPTVYSYAHIGNFRYFLFVDLLRRVLKNILGLKLKHVMNITDVGHLVSDEDYGEDKMMKAAKKENKSPWEIAKFYENAFLEDAKKLNIDMPEMIVRATDNIKEMEDYVKKIIENGFAYETEDTIYFDTSKLDKYGILSNINIEQQKEGARVEQDINKKNKTDFAIWIKAPKEHIMKWDSFFGPSYPGWHLECSTMSKKYLGEEFDIHTGGTDHISIHHENEIAQSKGECGKIPARYWIHSEFLQVDGGKTYTIRDLEEKGYNAFDFKFLTFSMNYNTKMNFTFESLKTSRKSVINLRKLYLEHLNGKNHKDCENGKNDDIDMIIEECINEFEKAVLDNLNMAKAISYVWRLAKYEVKDERIAKAMLKLDEIMGIDLINSDKYLNEIKEKEENININDKKYIEAQKLLEERKNAKENKEYDKADILRDKISNLGFVVIDEKQGSRIERKEN